MLFAPGATSQSVNIQVLDDTGLAVTGLVAATMPAIYYSLAGNTASTLITPLSDLALITTAWASGGVKERSGGWYRLDVPNAALATAGELTIFGEASGKHVLHPPIEIRSVGTPQTGDTFARVGAPVGASLSADLAAVKADTGAIPTAASNGTAAANAILFTPANKLATDGNNRVGVNNFPVEFLSSAEQSELAAAVADLVLLLGRTDAAPTVTTIQDIVNAIKAKTDSLNFSGNNLLADLRAWNGTALTTTVPLAASAYTAPMNPTDYVRNNVTPSWWIAPDNADIVTSLADLVTLIARADEATPIGAIKAVTDKYVALLNGGGTAFLASALINAPTGSGGGTTVDLALTITRNGGNQPVLSWTTDPLATAYKIMRSIDGTNYTQIAGVHVPTVTYTDTARPNAVNVFYSIVSVH